MPNCTTESVSNLVVLFLTQRSIKKDKNEWSCILEINLHKLCRINLRMWYKKTYLVQFTYCIEKYFPSWILFVSLFYLPVWVYWGIHGGGYKEVHLLGYNARKPGRNVLTFWRNTGKLLVDQMVSHQQQCTLFNCSDSDYIQVRMKKFLEFSCIQITTSC